MFNSVKNPRWNDSHNTTILCEVELKDGWSNYCASKNDTNEKGKAFFDELLSGKHGIIEKYRERAFAIPDSNVISDYKQTLHKDVDYILNAIYDGPEKALKNLSNISDVLLADVAQAHDRTLEDFKVMLDLFKSVEDCINVKYAIVVKQMDTITNLAVAEKTIYNFYDEVQKQIDKINKYKTKPLSFVYKRA